MELPGDEIHRLAAARVKVGGVGRVRGVDGHQDPLRVRPALEDGLVVGEDDVLEVPIAQGHALPVGPGHGGDLVRQGVPLRRVKGGAQGVVPLGLLPQGAPLAAVVQAGDAGHAEGQAVNQGDVGGIFQDAGGPGHVVVVGEAEKVLALVEGPRLRAELALEAVDDLEEVHGVQAGIEALVALVVGAGVEEAVPHPAVVVPVEGFAHQEELRLEAVAEAPEAAEEVDFQAVGHIQPEAVDAEFLHPELHALQQVVHHGGVAEVQLHQLEMALPALVPEAVVVVGIAVEVDMEPVLVGGVPFLFLHVPEGPEAPAHMVEHAVQHHPDAVGVEDLHHLGKVLVGSQAAVHLPVVPGVVAMAVAVEDGGEVEGAGPQLLDMGGPVPDFADAAYGYAVVFLGRAAEAQGIDLIEYAFVSPHS